MRQRRSVGRRARKKKPNTPFLTVKLARDTPLAQQFSVRHPVSGAIHISVLKNTPESGSGALVSPSFCPAAPLGTRAVTRVESRGKVPERENAFFLRKKNAPPPSSFPHVKNKETGGEGKKNIFLGGNGE